MVIPLSYLVMYKYKEKLNQVSGSIIKKTYKPLTNTSYFNDVSLLKLVCLVDYLMVAHGAVAQ